MAENKKHVEQGKVEKQLVSILEKYLKDKKMSTRKLAKEIKVSPETIQRWINSEQSMRINTWEKIKDYIDNNPVVLDNVVPMARGANA